MVPARYRTSCGEAGKPGLNLPAGPDRILGSVADGARILKSGGVVAYPTEACFGLGCDPGNAEAVRRILTMKRRSWEKGLILVTDRVERALPFLGPLPDDRIVRLREAADTPVSWVCPASALVSRWVRGSFDTIALRITRHPPTARLCRDAEMVVVSTSANRAGQPPLRGASEVARVFEGEVDLVVDESIGRAQRPSTIIDIISGDILRS